MRPSLLLLLVVRCLAKAHELEAAVSFDPPAVVLKTSYAGTEPVPFAKVQILKADKEFQAGMTDRQGGYRFVPNQPGLWKVVVDDQEGHRREVEITVPDRYSSSIPQPTSESPLNSRWTRVGFGVALILGATGALRFFKSRKSS